MNFQRFNQLLRMGVNPEIADRASSLYKGDKKSTSETNSTQTSTPYQQEQYKTLLGAADAWLKSGGYDQTYAGGMDTVADLTSDQQAALSGQSGLGTNLSSLFGTTGQNALATYLGDYDPNKTGLNAAIQAANDASNFNFETQVNPQIRQGATGAGQYGGTRHGIAEGLARGQLAATQQQNASTMAYQDQQAFNANKTNILSNLGTIASGLNAGNDLQYQSGQLQQTQAQNEIQGQLDKWAYENNIDTDTLNAYKSLISGDMGGTVTGQSTTKNTQSGGSALGALAGLAGTAAGYWFGGPVGAGIGSRLGSMVGNQIGGGSTQ